MSVLSALFFFNDTATTEIYTLSLHDALPISGMGTIGECRTFRPCRIGIAGLPPRRGLEPHRVVQPPRSEEHTSELQSLRHLLCRLLLENKQHRASPSRRERADHGVERGSSPD